MRSSTWTGRTASLLIYLLIAELVFDTVARYAFNAPTKWSYDLSYILCSALFMLGAAYTLMEEKHIRVEALYERFSLKARTIADLIGYSIFFFPPVVALAYFGMRFTLRSAQVGETSMTFWHPPMYPLKALIPFMAILLLLQGIAKYVKCIRLLRNPDGGTG